MPRSLDPSRTFLVSTMALVFAGSTAGAQEIVESGDASWYGSVPAGLAVPSDEGGEPVQPNVTSDFEGHASTNDWCSSLFWKRQAGNDFGHPMFAHPLAFLAADDGLLLGRPGSPGWNATEYANPFGANTAPIRLSVEGLSGATMEVAASGDWTVTPRWTDGARTLEATFGHGLPFVYATADGGRPIVEPKASLAFELLDIDGREACFEIDDKIYAAYAAPGRTWNLVDGVLVTDRPSEDGRFAVACLPDDSTAMRTVFRHAADARVVDARVAWSYDAAASEMVVDFDLVLEPSAKADPIVALFRHQWLEAEADDDDFLGGVFDTVRGDMKVLPARSFRVRHAFNGLLPNLPDVGQLDHEALTAELADVLAEPDLIDGNGIYWIGKAMGRVAALVPIAEQLGDQEAADRLLAELKLELEDWLRVDSTPDGADPDDRFLAYHADWGATIGYPGSFGSTNQLNDHHFHYGYLVMAAATIAQRDPEWAAAWGGAVEMLIKDVANWDRDDDRFPFLRNFDPYAGHSHASGHAAFARGNNQESSSESINFATATALWGAATGNDEIRDLGIFLHAVESRAIEQYWFDADGEILPEGFPHTQLGIVWGDGGDYATWWTLNPEEIHGINLLPITTGSLHLGRHPTMMRSSYAHLLTANYGPPTTWQGLVWSGFAMGQPTSALSFLLNNDYTPELGESRAHTRHWIESLAAWGRVDTSVTADTPHYAVFNDAGERTRLAWNPGEEPITVTFSDGVAGCVPPGEVAEIDEPSGPCGNDGIPGDLDGDGVVGGSDLGLMFVAWGPCTDADCPADLDGDGVVSGVDLGLLFIHWSG